MVHIQDNYIENILFEDLEYLKQNESLEIATYDKEYKIHKDTIITLDDVSIKFMHYNEVIDLDYDDIKYIYKINHHHTMFNSQENYFLVIYLIILAFVFGIALGKGL